MTDKAKCVCSMSADVKAFPVCSMPFNEQHPSKEWRGIACGNRNAMRVCCGHEKVCHAPQPSPTKLEHSEGDL
jgi:hypothetical protein